ncbi:MAG TPA: ABC transporter permease [Acidimicrobiia bacterium]|jgi:branched-subunit amino acid ABC-type transport system permease component
MDNFVGGLTDGIAFGSVYALLAIGLVLAYKTSGVFNIAFGVQAYASGALFYVLHTKHNVNAIPSFIVAVVVLAPLIGVILDRLFWRWLRSSSEVAKLVTATGLLVAIPGFVQLKFDQTAATSSKGIVPNGDTVYNWGAVNLTRDQIAIIVVTALVALAIWIVFRYTAVGLRMQGVVESPRMSELSGVNSGRVSTGAWMLTSFVAGLAGVLLPQITGGQVVDVYYTTLVTAAIVAAVLAALTSIPIALVAGLGLGIVQEWLNRFLPTNSVIAANVRPGLPFIALFLVLAIDPRLRHRRTTTDPMAGVDPPPPATVATTRTVSAARVTRIFWIVAGLIYLYYVMYHGNESVLDDAIRIAIFSIIFCSIVVITGLGGMLSFAQATFAGIGAAVSSQLASQQGMSVIATILIGALVTAILGIIVSLPSLRLGGIFLTLFTFAFALAFENVFLKFGWVTGGIFPEVSPRPKIGTIDFAHDKAFLVLCLVLLAIVAAMVVLVREGTTGRYLDAVRASEVGAASIGISSTRARIVAFGLSAGIAGLGGGLLTSYEGHYTASDWQTFVGLFWVVIVVTLGARTVEAAIQAAFAFVLFQKRVLAVWIPYLLNHVQPFHTFAQVPTPVQYMLFGLGAITYARHPEGILEYSKRRSNAMMERFRGGRGSGAAESDPAAPSPAGATA